MNRMLYNENTNWNLFQDKIEHINFNIHTISATQSNQNYSKISLVINAVCRKWRHTLEKLKTKLQNKEDCGKSGNIQDHQLIN